MGNGGGWRGLLCGLSPEKRAGMTLCSPALLTKTHQMRVRGVL